MKFYNIELSEPQIEILKEFDDTWNNEEATDYNICQHLVNRSKPVIDSILRQCLQKVSRNIN